MSGRGWHFQTSSGRVFFLTRRKVLEPGAHTIPSRRHPNPLNLSYIPSFPSQMPSLHICVFIHVSQNISASYYYAAFTPAFSYWRTMLTITFQPLP